MPELPEVETIKRGLLPHVQNQIIKTIDIRQPNLRWPVPEILKTALPKNKIIDIKRRGKYLLFEILNNKNIINLLAVHLGMSGNLQLVDYNTPAKKHDHVDIVLNNNKILRYHDPRRFGAILWVETPIELLDNHLRFKSLGPEPLTEVFSGKYLFKLAQKKTINVKTFIMTNSTVVGVGNIYATEALFYAKIKPTTAVNLITLTQWNKLAVEIKKVLTKAIECGGTTLKDFMHADGKPGYFKQELAAYGRGSQPCIRCRASLISIRQQGRATVYCEHCQK